MLISYLAEQLLYVVNPPPLTDTQRQKICLIEDINKIEKALTGRTITPKQFDELWDLPTFSLSTIVNDQSAVLNRIRYDNPAHP